jgi:serine protease AprX
MKTVLKKLGLLLCTILVIAGYAKPATGEALYFSELNRWLTIEKDMLTETYYAVDQSGNRIDADRLIRAQMRARRLKYGKLGPDLWRRLQAAGQEDRFQVHLFLQSTGALEAAIADERATKKVRAAMAKADYLKAIQQVRDYRLAIAESMVAMAGDEVMGLGGFVQAESLATHSLSASLDKAAILELQNATDIARIYADDILYEPSQDVAWRTMGAGASWPYGIRGGGVTVAVVEGDSIITTNRPYIDTIAVRDNSCPGNHATQVAHCIAARQNHWSGIAYLSRIVSANDCSWTATGLMEAMNWAHENHSPQVYNHSYGADTDGNYTALDQFLDQFSYDNAQLQVVASGNASVQCQSGEMYVSSPGLAYNVLTVGAFDDLNTTPRADDTMASFSCWENPALHPGKEKPEVVAPGVDIHWKVAGPPRSPEPNIFQTSSGTSFAAPLAAGLGALIEDAESSCFFGAPSGHKAAILATAAFDVDPTGSERDGVGAIFAGNLPEVFNNYGSNCWAGDGIFVDTDISVDFQKGLLGSGNKRIRVALVWEEDPSGIHRPGMPYPEYPQNDWDLIIIGPDGTTLASSTSTFNTWEVAEFEVTETGTYTIYLDNFGDSGITSKMTVVWAARP